MKFPFIIKIFKSIDLLKNGSIRCILCFQRFIIIFFLTEHEYELLECILSYSFLKLISLEIADVDENVLKKFLIEQHPTFNFIMTVILRPFKFVKLK